MDNNGKSRHSVWLSDEVWQEVDAFYKLDNCPTRNEFVEYNKMRGSSAREVSATHGTISFKDVLLFYQRE